MYTHPNIHKMLQLNIRLPELDKIRVKVASRTSINFSPTRFITSARTHQTQERLLVNHIRHVNLKYDLLMDSASSQEEKVNVVKFVYSCIGKTYPELAWEASRQLNERIKLLTGNTYND